MPIKPIEIPKKLKEAVEKQRKLWEAMKKTREEIIKRRAL